MTTSLSTTHPEILSFYEKHQLDFESMNLLFIEVLKHIMNNMDNSLNKTIANRIFERLSLVDTKLETLSSDLDHKMNASRKDYIQDLKLILTSNNVEQITPLIRETNSALLDKTSLILNEIIPKTNESVKKELHTHFQDLQKTLAQETSKLLSSSLDKEGIEDFLNRVQNTITQSNQSLITFVSSSETRLGNQFGDTNSKINEVKDILRENDLSQLKKSVNDVLTKFNYGIGKGTMSENILYNLLVNHYTTAEIENVSDKKETGDILFTQKNKPKILIENKDHESTNVPKSDVAKFIRDCDIQNCCGILLAQHRGIANKENFEIQFNNGNVLLYLHEVKFDINKISMAIDVVENIKMKMDELGMSTNNYTIDKDLLEEINQEFIYFTNQKASLFKLTREMNEKMLEKINELKMPNLQNFLSKRFAFSSNQKDNVCKYCNEPVKKSLMQHYRYCSAKKEIEKNGGSVSEQEDEEEDKESTEINIKETEHFLCNKCNSFTGKSKASLSAHMRNCKSIQPSL